ncbi:galectin-2-like [Scleropages formosus]|nr:galectin-2-like [Scleropages formosus]
MTELEIRNVQLCAGDKLKVAGFVLEDAERFQIDLGCNADDLALHFNPRFNDDADEMVIVCNSKCDGCWDDEQREPSNSFRRGFKMKVTIKITGEGFQVELPNGQNIQFPNRRGQDTLTYVRVKGHFRVTSFKIC